jgi:hypothetical protein
VNKFINDSNLLKNQKSDCKKRKVLTKIMNDEREFDFAESVVVVGPGVVTSSFKAYGPIRAAYAIRRGKLFCS